MWLLSSTAKLCGIEYFKFVVLEICQGAHKYDLLKPGHKSCIIAIFIKILFS